MNRLFSVLVVVVLLMLLVSPGAALASSSPRSADAPDAPLVLTWTQRNVSGFGDKNNAAVSSLEFFGGMLYAGATNDAGAQVWRTSDGDHWSASLDFKYQDAFGQGVLFDMIVFNGQLYAGVGSWYNLGVTGQIWRTDGTKWEQVTGAWGQNVHNVGVSNFAMFGGALYATTVNPSQGIEIYRTSTGNSNDWVRVATAASLGLNNAYPVASGLETFNNSLYMALDGQKGGAGARIYRTPNGTNWTSANTPGFGNSGTYGAGGFAVHKGSLYVGTRNDVTGGQIWRTADGANWTQTATSGFGNPLNYKIEGLVSALGTLFAFTDNDTTGTEVWSSVGGYNWEKSNIPGFGSANNKAVALWSNGAGLLGNQLFLGTFNQADGGQLWSATPPAIQMHYFYLPLIPKN